MPRESLYDARMAEPSIKEFAKGLIAHWKGSMSGGAGIVAALGASGLGWSNWQTWVWGAATAFVVGAYFLWADERRKVNALDKSEQREAVRLRVAELITEGAGIRNELCNEYDYIDASNWSGWETRATRWHKAALAEIAKVSPADAEWYRTLNVVPSPEIAMAQPPWGAEDWQLNFYAMHNFRLKKLEELVSGSKGNLLVGIKYWPG